jgi:hypothetical protein
MSKAVIRAVPGRAGETISGAEFRLSDSGIFGDEAGAVNQLLFPGINLAAMVY